MNSMEENKIYKLEELSKDRGSYGIAASAVPFSNHKYTYLRITDINDDGTLKKDNLMSVDEKNASDFLLKKNDIVFARTGNSTGRSYFYDGSDGELVFAGFLIKFSIDENKVNPRILKYYTHSTVYYSWIRSFDTGGTRGNINAKTYGEMPIMLPSRKKQDRIVDILKSFDDKIELNNRINANLEEQAQALFRRWFVDFEFPNEQGLPYKSNGGRFIDSELGKIPEGWNLNPLNYFGRIVCGKTPSKSIEDYFGGNIPFIKIPDMHNNIFVINSEDSLSSRGEKSQSNKTIPPYSILVSCIATVGLVCMNTKKSQFNQQINAIIPFNESFRYYIYLRLKTMYNKLQLLASGGSATLNLNTSQFSAIKIENPNKKLIIDFHKITTPFFKEIELRQNENIYLAQLRDSLLPKLMNNEIKI